MEGYNQLTCIMALGCRRHIKTNFWLDGSLIHSQEVGMKYIHHKLRIWLHGLNVLWYKYHIFIYPSFLVLHALLRLIFLAYSVRYWLLIFFCNILEQVLFNNIQHALILAEDECPVLGDCGQARHTISFFTARRIPNVTVQQKLPTVRDFGLNNH